MDGISRKIASLFFSVLKTVLASFIPVLIASGCVSFGPNKIVPDRISYIQEIGESSKQQMLLNIVKLRYFDPPVFLEITSVINQYELQSQVQADARFYWPRPDTSAANAGGGASLLLSDRPTITYSPLSGQKFTQNLLTPIPPFAVVSLIHSGWSIDLLFSLTVKTINGVNNSSAAKHLESEDQEFNSLVKALRTVQVAGISDFRVEKIGDQETIVFVISENAGQRCMQERETINRLLKLDPDVNTYRVVFGALPSDDKEIAILTRSMLEIMMEVAALIDAPSEHIEQKWVNETAPFPESEWMQTRIHSGREKPKDTFTSVQYQDYWFWIDNNDIYSKRNFALIMIFLSLTESEQKIGGPLLTIGGK